MNHSFKLKKLIKMLGLQYLILGVLTLTIQSYAGETAGPAGSNANESTSNNNNGTNGNKSDYKSGTSPFNAAVLDSAMNSSGSAGSGSGGQAMGAAMNLAASGVMAAMGYQMLGEPSPSSKAMGAFLVAQAALAAAQSIMQSGTSKGNKAAQMDFRTDFTGTSPDSGGDGSGGPGNSNSDDPLNTRSKGFNTKNNDFNASLPPDIKKIVDKINSTGSNVDLQNMTFTDPNGNSISLNDASDAGKFEAKLNLPPGTYAKGMNMVEEIMNKMNASDKNNMGGIDSYAGSHGGSSEGVQEGYDGSGGKGNQPRDANSSIRSPASSLVAGLTSKYNGENIGVAADDIFMMVNRRYNVKILQDSFIGSEQNQNFRTNSNISIGGGSTKLPSPNN